MICKKYELWEKDEYSYARAEGFLPNIMNYTHEDEEIRPCMIVVPGGAYFFLAPSEGEIVARKFYEFGYNTFVLSYTVNPLCDAPLHEQPSRDLSRAIRYIRANGAALKVNPKKLVICGFSAGGHLCGTICVHHADISEENPRYKGFSNKPDAAILSYPVISSGEYAHRGSFDALIGPDGSNEEKEYYSLEKHVSKDAPPCFIWQTAADETVPVENSYLFARALKDEGVPFSHHVFPEGQHGLSTADADFANSNFGEPYVMDQYFRVVAGVKAKKIPIKKEIEEMMDFFKSQYAPKNEGVPKNKGNEGVPENEGNEYAAMWTELARMWLKQLSI